MMENSGTFLNDEAVLAIVRQKPAQAVSLAAFDCNWVSENTAKSGKNYFKIWVAVSYCEKKDKVFLHGARFSNWNVEYEMKLVGTVNKTGVYALSLDNPDEFPNEFVVLVAKETGERLYDNNNYRNFSIECCKGHFATAISQNGNIFSFDSIIPVTHICLTH